MTDHTILLIGATLALVGPLIFLVLARSVRRSQISYLPLSLLVVVFVESLLVSTAVVTKALLNVVGSPVLAFIAIAAVQSTLLAISVRLTDQGTT